MSADREFRVWHRLALLCGTLLLAPAAWGQTTEPREECSQATPSFCLNGVSSTVTGYDGLRVAARPLAQAADEDEDEEGAPNALTRRMVAHALGTQSTWGFGTWASYARSTYEGTVPVAPYEADLDSLLLGFDRLLNGGGALGLALIVEHRETDTVYNGGGEEADGFGLAVFGVHPLNPRTSIDWTAGYTGTSTDQDRIDPADGSSLIASFDSTRWFAATNIVGLQEFGGAWLATGRFSLIYATEDFDGYTETGGPSARTVRDKQVDLLQTALAYELAYAFGAVEPYAFLGYRYDIDREDGSSAGGLPGSVGNTQPDDKDEGETGLGLRWFGRSTSLSGEWLHTFARDEFENDTFSLLFRSEF